MREAGRIQQMSIVDTLSLQAVSRHDVEPEVDHSRRLVEQQEAVSDGLHFRVGLGDGPSQAVCRNWPGTTLQNSKST